MNKSSPLVSIAIPTYNNKNHIVECIESALIQTYSNFEIIISDNASDDGTWEICNRFSKKDSRIKINQNNENMGPVLNWKKCASMASGEYLKFLFSDDLLEKECLEKMVPILKDEKASFAYCAARIGKKHSQSSVHYLSKNYHQVSRQEFLNLLVFGNAPVSPGAVLMRTRDFLSNLREDFPTSQKLDYKSHGAGPDVMSFVSMMKKYEYALHIPQALVFFREHEKSLTCGARKEEIKDSYRCVLSWHLRNDFSKESYFNYIAMVFLFLFMENKKIISPHKILSKYNGTPTFFEVKTLIKSIAKMLFFYISSKKRNVTVVD